MTFKEKIKEIEEGKNLDIHINDPNEYLIKSVDRCDYKLNKLINDSNLHVRIEIHDHDYDFDKFMDDPYKYIRKAIIDQDYILDKLINDPNPCIRFEFVRQGCELNKIADYSDEEVIEAIIWYTVNKNSKEFNEFLKNISNKGDGN